MVKTRIHAVEYNRFAWDKQVKKNNPFTIPVTHDIIEAARNGKFSILLTETKP